MSRVDGVLVVVLKRQPFEDILSGRKTEEYRGTNWASRLFSDEAKRDAIPDSLFHPWDGFWHPYHTLRAFDGYRKGRRVLERRIRSIRWGVPRPEWSYGIVSGPCFVIELDSLAEARGC